MKRTRAFVATVALALGVVGCGSRSGLGLPSSAEGGSGGSAGTAGTGGSSPDDDRCPSAVAGPAPMWRSCSTRDGRSRVSAPQSPTLGWTKQLPTQPSGQLGLSAVVTGGEDEAYVVTSRFSAADGEVRRVRAADGSVDWTLPIVTDQATLEPVVLANGLVDLYARDETSKSWLFQVDGGTGSSSKTTFGFDFYSVPPNPAVGADGSLYLAHSKDVGTANAATFVSRVRPDGTVAWTTPALADLVGAPSGEGDVFPSVIALDEDDTAITVVERIVPSGIVSVVLAFDAPNGAVRWQTTFSGQLLGGPAVRPDGRIAVLAGPLTASHLELLEPETGAPESHALPVRVINLFAITRSGMVIAGLDDGEGLSGVVAFDGDGTPLWTRPEVPRSVTVAADGSVVLFAAPAFLALDPANGATRWQLSVPHPSSCLLDAAPTQQGGLIGLQCDGTLFGASD